MLPCTLFEFEVHSEAACILNVCPTIRDTYIPLHLIVHQATSCRGDNAVLDDDDDDDDGR